MRIFALILLLFFVNFCYAEYDETTTDVPSVISEKVIETLEGGYCNFEIKKRNIVSVPVQYMDTETFYGRCRGYYFKKCLQERQVSKTRYENQIREVTETVRKCCNGYAQNEDKSKCLPICEHPCQFGSCTEPNVCSCYEGYSLTNKSNVCAPNCGGCTHGTCLVPNLCACNSGYEWSKTLKECVPFCSGMCHNGKCTSPETCECNKGYIHHATHSICIPHCENECVNGVCNGPNTCECNFGYHFKNESQNVCEPKCEMSCQNAKCIEPNVCECHSGYSVLDDEKPHECHCGLYCVEIDNVCHCLDDDHRINGDTIRNNMSVICTEKNCKNGVCVSVHECSCNTGFEKDDASICVPVDETCMDDPASCDGNEVKSCNCINGICTANDTCVCVNGFGLKDDHNDLCEPMCSKECINSYCINPDQCECNEGYRLGYNESETHICHPICNPDVEDENGCTNGTCIAPGECQCFEGFMISNERNYTCIPDPFYAEKMNAGKLNWIIPALTVCVILVAIIAAVKYFTSKKQPTYIAKLDDEAQQPIAKYLNGDL